MLLTIFGLLLNILILSFDLPSWLIFLLLFAFWQLVYFMMHFAVFSDITKYNIEVKIAMSRPLFEREIFLQVRGTGYNLLNPVWDQKTLLNDFIDLSRLVKHSVDSFDMHTCREINYGYMGIHVHVYTFSGRWNGKFCGSIDNIWM